MTLSRSLSRRGFLQVLGAGTAVASFGSPRLAAVGPLAATPAPAPAALGAVRLSANENPYGPSPVTE